MAKLMVESLFPSIENIGLEKWRSNPLVNMENDMARITIDMPLIQGIMLKQLIKPYITIDSQY